jgi:hypothetical protein
MGGILRAASECQMLRPGSYSLFNYGLSRMKT